jgi:DNA-binding CsgD family transcriptional regulator
MLARSVAEQGHADAAIRSAREAATLFRQFGRPQFQQFCLTSLALAQAIAGLADAAAETLDAIDALDLPPTLYFGVDLQIARAWTAAAAGAAPRAHKAFEEAANLGAEIGDRVGEIAALHGLLRTGAGRAVADRLVRAADGMEGRLAPARVAHAEALTRRDPVALEEAATEFEAISADLLAAEAAADAAAAWRRAGAGSARRVAAAEHRARALARLCPGAATPALLATSVAVELTKAELRVARLAEGGRSNKEVADELFLSVRTVETHLQNIYQKLGISGRAELAAALKGVS